MPNLSLTPLQNASKLKEKQNANSILKLPLKLAFHDLTEGQTESKNARLLLGMGRMFIPTPHSTTEPKHLEPRLGQFERLLKLRIFYAGEENNNEPLSKLRMSSKWVPPDEYIPREVSKRMAAFRQALMPLFERRKAIPKNLNPVQRKLLHKFSRDKKVLTINTDKGLGCGRIEYDRYIKDMFDNHLNDQTTYRLLSREDALDETSRIKDELEKWINEYSATLGKETFAFLLNHLQTCKEHFSFAYQLYKIHKTPTTTRAIISGSGSLLHPLGHWITEQLCPVTLTMPGYLESSYALKEEIVPLTLPPNARLFTCDCVAMYPSFPYVATEIVGDFLYTHHSEFKYNPDALTDGLKLLMENMIF